MSVQHPLRVRMTEDRRHAYLELDRGEDLGTLQQRALAAARSVGVAVDAEVEGRIAAAAKAYADAPGTMKVEIASAYDGEPPVDGAVTWEKGCDPLGGAQQGTEQEAWAPAKAVCVTIGQCVARLRSARAGTDGRDVAGMSLPGRPARGVALKFGEGLRVEGEDRVVAVSNGVLTLDGLVVKVTALLHLPGDVGPGTGNVEFDGAICVAGCVCPSFRVDAGKDLRIAGLVEDASVSCGGMLECQRGLTAKTHGEVRVGGDLHAVFLNTIHGTVGGDLRVHREIMHCGLEVGGSVRSPRAALLGGRVRVQGSVEVNELGSATWQGTELSLGWSVRAGIDARIHEVEEHIKTSRAQYEQIKAMGKRATATQRESLTELEFSLWELEQELAKRQGELTRHLQLGGQPTEEASRSVMVYRTIHAKTRVLAGNDDVLFRVDIHGPVKITMDSRDRLVASVRGGRVVGLEELALGGRAAAA